MKYSRIPLIVLVLFSQAAAQEISRIRNPLFAGARPMAMGESFVGIASGTNAIYWNPAGLPLADGYEIQFMHSDLYQALYNEYLAILVPSLPFIHDPDRLAFGFDWHNINPGRDDNAELKFSQNKFSLSTGYRLTHSLSIGGNLKYLANSFHLDDELEGQASGWGIDIGALYAPVKNLRLGLMIHDATNTRMHFGAGKQYDNEHDETLYYRNIRFGAAYQFKDFFIFKEPILAMDLDDRIHLGTEIWLHNILALRGGLQKDLGSKGEDEMTLSFGFGLKYKFLQMDYAYTDSPFLENTSRFSISFNFNPPPSPVKIKRVLPINIFPSQSKYHQKNTWLEVELDHVGDRPVECRLSAESDKFGIRAKRTFKIDPKVEKNKRIDLIPILPDDLFKLDQSDEQLTGVKITLESRTTIPTKTVVYDTSFVVYRANRIYWGDGVAPAAAFINGEDEAVKKFAALAKQLYDDQPDSVMISRNITLAVYLQKIMDRYGIKYKTDSNFPRKDLDIIQYPHELLKSRQGDCDDITVLYASLLESLGIQTALVDIPLHIFLLFDTGIHETRALKLCCPGDQYVIIDNYVWLPLETTILNESFLEAWHRGAAQYHEYRNQDEFDVIKVEDAWNIYPNKMRENITDSLNLPVAAVIKTDYCQNLAQHRQFQHIYLNDNYYEPLKKNPYDIEKYNELGIIFNLIGNQKKAEEHFKKALKISGIN